MGSNIVEWNLLLAALGRKAFLILNGGVEKPGHTATTVVMTADATYDIAGRIVILTSCAFTCLLAFHDILCHT
jgi:hypothetical protein